MAFKKYENNKYEIEKQVPFQQDNKWYQKIYTYQKGLGDPINEELKELTEEEALALLPSPPKKEFISISLPELLSSISYEDQDKLAAYFQAKPIVKEFLSAGKLTQGNIHVMKARVDADFANAVIDEESKIRLQYKLDELLTRF